MPWFGNSDRVKEEVRPKLRHVWQRVVVIGNHIAGVVNTLSGIVLTMTHILNRLVEIEAKLEAIASILKDVPTAPKGGADE